MIANQIDTWESTDNRTVVEIEKDGYARELLYTHTTQITDAELREKIVSLSILEIIN